MRSARPIRPSFILPALLVLALLASAAPTAAQDVSIPPWPLLFRGTALLDGAPVVTGQLRVRVGDWESEPVPVRDGGFECAAQCLIAGPPSLSYIGQPVTFHLNDTYLGDVTFAFPAGATPQQLEVYLLFSQASPSPALPLPTTTAAPQAPATDPSGASGSWWAWLVAGGVVISGTGMRLWELRRRRAPRASD